jgi:opacity protein-like surface antigen
MQLTDKLVAYGKAGVAYSVMTPQVGVARAIARETGKPVRGRESDTGRYVGVGAQYNLSENTSVDAQYGNHGGSAKQWGKDTNSSGVRANLKMGF